MDMSIESAINSLRTGYIMTDKNGNIQYMNNKGGELLQVDKNKIITTSIFNLIPAMNKNILSDKDHFFYDVYYSNRKFFFNYSPLYLDKKNELVGGSFLFNEEQYYEVFLKELDAYKNLNSDLKAIFDISYDVIYVSDEKGTTLRVSSACKKLWGKAKEELIGKNVYELEKSGIYKPSVTRLVLERKETVSLIQETQTGRRLMVVGTPIKDENGEITRVVNASRDITAVDRLQAELDETTQLMEGYKKELEYLRRKTSQNNDVVYQSIEMERVISLAQKVANVDSTVLILGETGVGKEVIANYIHSSSERSDKPFITINCGAIPKDLLESELFGYEKGAFTGAAKQKRGLLELANNGTLFLDEIGEMPLSLQIKLLRFLQEQKFTRIGGIEQINVNIRIITATNRDLFEEVKNGTFREDLYYRLNVIPIKIPPLRDRKEDILSLIHHFLQVFNEKYARSKTLSNGVIEMLQQYDWPGNVRELQNIIERLVVLSENDVIDKVDLDAFLIPMGNKHSEDVIVNNIIPLKKCIRVAEDQLLKLAKQKYKTATKIAEILEVNQSTISRKLKRLDG